ncbi:hypothetical protein HBH77_209510 [Parastagonospora nodorum]|nr:hypothetical protein HBH77_209510 [Parastagonospora nodorum]
MSQEDYARDGRSPLPGPPPSAHSYTISPGQTSPLRRLALQPPRLTTSLAPQQQSHSAVNLSVPYSPFVASSPSTYAPSPSATASPMAMRNTSVPYNPQQWTRNVPVSGQYAPHTAVQAAARTHDMTGMEAAMPSPPPPYSPAHPPQNMSQTMNSSPQMQSHGFPHPPPPPPPTSTPSSSRPVSGFASRPGSIVIPSSATSITSNQQFPPPPARNGPGRSASRDKLASKFSLSSFRNRNNELSPGPSAIESLQINTSDAIQRAPASPGLLSQRAGSHYLNSALAEHRYSPETHSPLRAPAARRAASAGILGHGTEIRTPIEESPSIAQGNWGRSMPLPPPPPGPPPSSSRSQSVGPGASALSPASGVELNREPSRPSAPPTRRPGQTPLATIPPTPQGWQDEPSRERTRSPAARNLHIDTSPEAVRPHEQSAPPSEAGTLSISSGPTVTTSRSGGTLYRTPSRRESSALGIRERRSESRAARERVEPSNNPWAQELEASSTKPANLDLETGLTRRGAITKGTPRSGGVIRSPRSGNLYDDPSSANSTPRMNVPQGAASMSAPTPPFSPDVANRSASQLSIQTTPGPDDSQLSTPRPATRDAFAQASVERHRQFVEKESAAETDQERLELFAEFIVRESRLRRDRYSSAFDAMAGDIMDLTRDLWRSYGNTGRRSATPNAQITPSILSGRRSQASVAGGSPDTRPSASMPTTAASPASSVGNFTPHTEPASPASASSQKARDTSWSNNYHPSLSPIPSMAMSTIPDEEGSRGRSASRWWESDGGSSVGGDRRLERSKRESKYMSLQKENLQWTGDDQSTPQHRAESSSRPTYSTTEYPPEKVGLHEDFPYTQPEKLHGFHQPTTPAKPDPRKLDVSRLVTLPPSYPRHHPAVNNSHPDLASIRSGLRTISDLEDVKNTKSTFAAKIEARKEQESTSLSERRAELRYNIQDNVRTGVMSFADAAKAEADFDTREHQRAQDVVQWIFDTFQAEVANSLHAMFCERITKVSASIEHLKGRLCSDAQDTNPNQTQEEGDEKPELLEILTLLKWLFEARELLHKEMFELENERNDLYRDIIVLPYVQAKNDQKVKEATDFFQRDAQDRKVTFEKDILKRYEDILAIIEQNVTRGVEAQLSAFWDIAPGLLAIVQQVPLRLHKFEVLVPQQEYEETPAYHDYPLQYLYSLLAHAGRSAYQFIESQINLLCLLHEVKTAVMTAGSRLLETQRLLEGEDLAGVDQETRAIRADEERRLTDDLKEKVGLVESQWNEALGQGLEECKSRVEDFLTEQGGWDDSLRE